MNKSKIKYQISKISILVASLIIIPLACRAFSFEEFFDELKEWFSNSTSSNRVINEVNVSANTGNNIINGEVKEGETKSKVYVKNIINGKEIEPVEIESKANKVNVKSKIEAEGKMAQVQREIEIDSERSTTSYEVNLENSDNQESNQGKLEKIYDWWVNFWEVFTASLQDIFNIFKK
jgi:hypothetical protein